MRYRQLGSTSLELSVVGLGTWAIGGSGWQWAWGPQDDSDSISTIHHALDCGINWIDTAAVYGMGHSEEVVGKAISGMSEKPFIATKCGRKTREDGTVYGHLKADSIRREAEVSLQRLGVEVIDLYQIHWPDPPGDLEEAWDVLAELQKEGKIRYAGVSNFPLRYFQRIMPIMPPVSLQPPYSMLKRDIERELLPYCGEHDIGVICYSPMQKGLLSGAFDRARMEHLAEDDHRKRDPMFNEPKLSQNIELVEKLNEIAARTDHSMAQLAIAWVLRRPEVTAAIVGGRRPSQIEETAKAGDYELTPAEVEEIERILSSPDGD